VVIGVCVIYALSVIVYVVTVRALQLRREAQMVSPVMGAAMIGTMYFLRANCDQHGGSASGGGLISASTKLQGSSYGVLPVG